MQGLKAVYRRLAKVCGRRRVRMGHYQVGNSYTRLRCLANVALRSGLSRLLRRNEARRLRGLFFSCVRGMGGVRRGGPFRGAPRFMEMFKGMGLHSSLGYARVSGVSFIPTGVVLSRGGMSIVSCR